MGSKLQHSMIVLIGGGGHATVVREAAQLSGRLVVGYFDDEVDSSVAAEIPRLGCFQEFTSSPHSRILAIGDLTTRRRFATDSLDGFDTVLHPAATLSHLANIGSGTFIGATAVVNPYSNIGAHTIVNTRAVIEHHCTIGANCHIGPGAVLGGGVTVDENTLVGISATVNPGIRIGKNCVVGAGSVVTQDVPDGSVVVGVPARPIPQRLRKSA